MRKMSPRESELFRQSVKREYASLSKQEQEDLLKELPHALEVLKKYHAKPLHGGPFVIEEVDRKPKD